MRALEREEEIWSDGPNDITQRRPPSAPLTEPPTAPRRRAAARSAAGGHLRTIVTLWEQVTVAIRGHLNRGVTEPRLHHLQRQLEAAVDGTAQRSGVRMTLHEARR